MLEGTPDLQNKLQEGIGCHGQTKYRFMEGQGILIDFGRLFLQLFVVLLIGLFFVAIAKTKK